MMSKIVRLTKLTAPVADAWTFDVRSPSDTRGPLRVLRAWDSDTQPAIVLIAPATESGSLEELIEAMMPTGGIPSPTDALQARRNADARWRLLSEFGALTATQVADLAGSEAKNRSALAGHWLRSHDIFAVTHNATRYFPAFQFDETGRPRPVIRSVLAHLSDLGDWQRAIWFTTRTRLLDDQRPVDLLEQAPDRVVAAAEADAQPLD